MCHFFYGWHVPKGELHAKKYITQIAPTLSQMLKIPFTNGTESEVLETLLDNKSFELNSIYN
jgi:hypothetical protein